MVGHLFIGHILVGRTLSGGGLDEVTSASRSPSRDEVTLVSRLLTDRTVDCLVGSLVTLADVLDVSYPYCMNAPH